MSIKDFLRVPRMECELSPAAVGQEVSTAESPVSLTKHWEIVNSARKDARRVKWVMALATVLALYGATELVDESKGAAIIFCSLAALTACVANDHRRFQKVHADTLNTGALQQITTKRINWHLYE